MKTTLLALVLLFALSSQPLLATSDDASPDEVVDTSGKELQAGANYYIIPTNPFTACGRYGICLRGLGLTLASFGERCPLDVVIADGYQGMPLKFTPVNPKSKGVVHVSTDLNIMFSSNHTSCLHHSTVWKVGHFDVSMRQWFVTTGGVVGNPAGRKSIRSWFKIEKNDGAYKIVYCPNVCRSCKHNLCKDVGVVRYENDKRRLVLSDDPLKVQFQLA